MAELIKTELSQIETSQVRTSHTGQLEEWYTSMRFRMRLLPWQVVAGGSLLLLSLLSLLLVVLPQVRALDQLESSVAELRKSMPRHAGKWIAPSPQASLNTFYEFLPPESDTYKLVGKLLDAAATQGIAPEKAEYQLTRLSAAPISRYQVTLPLHAEYVAVRRFMIDVLNTLPNAAITEVSITRDEQAEGMVNARLRFSFYLQSPGYLQNNSYLRQPG